MANGYPDNLPPYVPPPLPPQAQQAAKPKPESTLDMLKNRGKAIMDKVNSMATGEPFDAR